MTSADKTFAIGALLFCVMMAWLISISVALQATAWMGLVWVCLSRGCTWLVPIIRINEREVVVRGPLGLQLLCFIFSLPFGIAAVAAVIVLATQTQMPPDFVEIVAGIVAVVFCVAAWFVFFYFVGPNVMRLDLKRGHYRSRVGLPLFPKIHVGSLEEITAVEICGPNAEGQFSTYLVWRHPDQGRTLLEVSLNADEAAERVAALAALLGVSQTHSQVFLKTNPNCSLIVDDEDVLVFRKPKSLRLVLGVIGKGLTLASLIGGGTLAIAATGLHFYPNRPFDAFWFLLDAVGVLALWGAGPQDLEINWSQGTYLYRSGFLCFARTVSGSLNDIQEIRLVQTSYQPRYIGFQVSLVWTSPFRRPVILGYYENK